MHPIDRRKFLGTGLAASGMIGVSLATPAWARGGDIRHSGILRQGFDEISGSSINLNIAAGQRMVQGRRGHGIAVNGSVPGPLIRLKEGEPVKLNVTNSLDEDSSIHWHGLLVPFQYDGVPGVRFPLYHAGPDLRL